MKRYDLELTATGPVMEERKEGVFAPFSEVERLLASHHKREQALVDLVHRMVTMMDMAGEEAEKDSLNPLRAWVYDAGTLLAGQLPPPQSNRGITLMMSELHDIIVGLDIPGGAQNSAEVWGQVIAARDRVQVCLSSGCPDTEWTDATPAPTEQDYRELQAQHDQVQSRLKGALDLLRKARGDVEQVRRWARFSHAFGRKAEATILLERIDALLAGQVKGRTITEGQEFELTAVLQSIANGFSDDPAHDAAALLKRIAGVVPWTGDSFRSPPCQGGEPCATASPSSSKA